MGFISYRLKQTLAAVTLLTVGVLSAKAQDNGDPPARVARLNYVSGNVSMEPAGLDEWVPATINRPFTTGDYLYTDNGAQAELHMDIAVVRMAAQTSFGFLNLDDRTVQLKLTEGNISVRLRNFGTDQVFEVDTPNGAITLLRDGLYRFSVDPNGTGSFVVVRQGEAEITGGGQAFSLAPGRSASLSGTDQMTFDLETAPDPDQFDNWCSTRDAHEMRSRSAQYLPPSVIGYEDLDDYGGWQSAPEYGSVWFPRSVPVGWAPYHDGHWAWIEPWGYTWVDSSPWGFAPFHYGRWAFISNRWGWCPGPVGIDRRAGYFDGPRIRPYYAPALVAFFGGDHFGVGISFGGGGGGFGGGRGLAWAPLGYGEVYAPPYHVSPRYFNNVNVSNTTLNKTVNVTNVYNNVYVNKTYNNVNQRFVNASAPGGVSGMNQAAFAAGRPVQQAGFVVPQNQVARLQQTGSTLYGPPVAPTRQSVAPAAATGPVARPSAQVSSRPVIARTAPPPAAPAFAARQQSLQQNINQNPGQPVNFAAMHQAAVRQAPVQQAQMQQVQQGAARVTPAAAPVRVLDPSTMRRTTPVIGRNVPNAAPLTQPAQPSTQQHQPAMQAQRPVQAQTVQPQVARPQAQQAPAAQTRAVQGRPAQTEVTQSGPAPVHGMPPHGTPPNRVAVQQIPQPSVERAGQPVQQHVQENPVQRAPQAAPSPRAAEPPAPGPQRQQPSAEQQQPQHRQVEPRPVEQQQAQRPQAEQRPVEQKAPPRPQVQQRPAEQQQPQHQQVQQRPTEQRQAPAQHETAHPSDHKEESSKSDHEHH